MALGLTLTLTGCLGRSPEPIVVTNTSVIKNNIPIQARPKQLVLSDVKWYVVSEARITNPCKKIEDKRPKTCDLSERENPDWPEGYTYLDRFLDEMKEQNNGEVVFVATSVGDYKVMAEDMQELKRYITELKDVVVYYREVTMPPKDEPSKD